MERGDWLRTKPIHPSKVVGRQRSASAKGLIYKEPRWHPTNDANPDVNQNTVRKPKAPPPVPPERDNEPIVKWLKDAFKGIDPKVLEQREKELRELTIRHATEDKFFRRGTTPGKAGSSSAEDKVNLPQPKGPHTQQ